MLLRVLPSITGVPGRHVRITGRCSRSRSLLSGIACLWQGSPQAADWFSRQIVTPFWKQDCVLGCPGDPNRFYRPGMEGAARREAGGGLEGLLPNFPAMKNTVMPVQHFSGDTRLSATKPCTFMPCPLLPHPAPMPAVWVPLASQQCWVPGTLAAVAGEVLPAVNAMRQEGSTWCCSQCHIKANGHKMPSKIPLHWSTHLPGDWAAGSRAQQGSCTKMQPADQVGLFLSHQNKTRSDQELLMKLLICACSARHCKRQTLEAGAAHAVSGCWGDPRLPS